MYILPMNDEKDKISSYMGRMSLLESPVYKINKEKDECEVNMILKDHIKMISVHRAMLHKNKNELILLNIQKANLYNMQRLTFS